MIGLREPSGEEIARRAHELYLQRGGEHGKDVEDWVRVERRTCRGTGENKRRPRRSQRV
jgi:hypothetical protein